MFFRTQDLLRFNQNGAHLELIPSTQALADFDADSADPFSRLSKKNFLQQITPNLQKDVAAVSSNDVVTSIIQPKDTSKAKVPEKTLTKAVPTKKVAAVVPSTTPTTTQTISDFCAPSTSFVSSTTVAPKNVTSTIPSKTASTASKSKVPPPSNSLDKSLLWHKHIMFTNFDEKVSFFIQVCIFLTMNIHFKKRNKLKDQVLSIQGTNLDETIDLPIADIVVCDRLIRSQKLISALASGKIVVPSAYIVASARKDQWEDVCFIDCFLFF